MSSKVITLELTLPWFSVNALAFLPSLDKQIKSEWAFFSHGYTSHKGDCLNWATRLVESGSPCLIFDNPGHYLGSFHDLNSWDDFKDHVHELYGEAFNRLEALMQIHIGDGQYPRPSGIILGGHSMGAFTSLRALELPIFEKYKRVAVAIGIGIGQRQGIHLFETAFYEKTLSIRRQLVSPILDPKVVFQWLKTEKETMAISNQRIHCITGDDDVVVGPGGLEAFVEVLEKNNNVVTFERPKRLPHHEPGAATPHIFAFLKDHFGWS
jgi:pimeloyl-ACP methyl ester carboxylesterase